MLKRKDKNKTTEYICNEKEYKKIVENGARIKMLKTIAKENIDKIINEDFNIGIIMADNGVSCFGDIEGFCRKYELECNEKQAVTSIVLQCLDAMFDKGNAEIESVYEFCRDKRNGLFGKRNKNK